MALTQISQAGAKDEAINEAKIQISNAGTNGQFLQKQSGNTGGLTWADVPAGVGGSNGADFNDNVKIRLGTGNDLEIFHENSNNTSRINSTTGNIEIRHTVSSADEALAKFIPNGAVELFHNGTKRIATTAAGFNLWEDTDKVISFSGGIGEIGSVPGFQAANGDLSALASFGIRATDLRFATGSHERVRIDSTGDVKFWGTTTADSTNKSVNLIAPSFDTDEEDVNLIQYEGESSLAQISIGGGTSALNSATTLRFLTSSSANTVSGTERLRITSGGDVSILNDSGKFTCGTSDDLEIYHNGTNSIIAHTTGSGSLLLWPVDAEHGIAINANSSVDLYYDNAKKFETTSVGVRLSGNYQANDGYHIYMGSGNDLDIYHNGTQSFIDSVNNHALIVRAGTGDMYLQGANIYLGDEGAAEKYIDCHKDGAVELYYNNTLKFETNPNGCLLSDDVKLQLGGNADLQIYHNGTHSYVENSTGNLLLRPKSGEDGVTIIPDGAVKLAYDDATKISTKSHGVDVTDGELRIGDADDGNDALIRLGATGTNTDTHAVIYYDKSSNYLSMVVSGESHGTHGLMIENGGDVRTDDIIPHSNNNYNLGSSSVRWANIYTNDLNLSNKGSSNEVDGTWGNYTIQEGEDDLFLINRRNGKKYKFNLTEIS